MKQKTVFLCGDCGYESPKWYGKCPSCGAWNTMSEFKEKPVSAARGTNTFQRGESRPTLLKDIDTGDESRFHSGIGELDRVLGGGAVHGSFVLVGGEPGIGKSTLLLQMCQEMCKNARVLYVSGEESLKQIKIRAARLHISSPELYILAETDMEQIINETELLEPDILIVDSIQTVYKRDLTAAPGGTTQIKECAMSLMQYAKNRNVTIFIVGHVNKEGTLAGPKIPEHMVDCVLYFEGESAGPFRCLRAAKNRYGSTNEIGVFEMSDHGLLEVQNPSAAMLAGHPQGASGNCIACVMEGSRPLLAEVQALAAKTQFGVRRGLQPHGAAACHSGKTLRAVSVVERCVCQRRRRHAAGRARCGFADGAGNRIQLSGQAAAGRRHELRRGRPDRRAACGVQSGTAYQ